MCSYIFLHTRGPFEHAPTSEKSVFFAFLFFNIVGGKRRHAALIQRAERAQKSTAMQEKQKGDDGFVDTLPSSSPLQYNSSMTYSSSSFHMYELLRI